MPGDGDLPPGQSQVAGWTALIEPLSPSNASDNPEAVEMDYFSVKKRKADDHISSARSLKEPRTSIERALAPNPYALTLDSSDGLRRVVSHASPSGSASVLRQTAGTSHSLSQRKAITRLSLSDDARYPSGSKSVSSLAPASSSSRGACPTDRASSSSSESLADPIDVVDAYSAMIGRRRHPENNGKNKVFPNGGFAGNALKSASSPTRTTLNLSVNKTRSTPKSRTSGGSKPVDDELIIISSDSDDDSRKAPSYSNDARQGKARGHASKANSANSDRPIDLTSDNDLATSSDPHSTNRASGSAIPSVHSAATLGGRNKRKHDPPPHDSRATSAGSRGGRVLAPPPDDAEIIDLCSESDEMEVDSLLAPSQDLPDTTVSSSNLKLSDGSRNDAYSSPLQGPQTLMSSQRSSPVPLPHSDFLASLPSSSFPERSLDNSDGPESALETILHDQLSISQRTTPAELDSPFDSSFNREPSDTLDTVAEENSGGTSTLLHTPSIRPARPSTRTVAPRSPSPMLMVQGGRNGVSEENEIFQQQREMSSSSRPQTMSSTCPTSSNPTEMASASKAEDTVVSGGDMSQDPTEALVIPVSDTQLQSQLTDFRDDSPDPLDTFSQRTELMKSDSLRKTASGAHASASGSSSRGRQRPVQYARKTVSRPAECVESAGGSRSYTSSGDGSEARGRENRLSNAHPSRNYPSVNDRDRSNLRSDDQNAPENEDGLYNAIDWPAEKIPTELHDMLNHLPRNYHYNPQMKHIFESMMEENTAEDEPTSPRIEIYSGQPGPVCPPWEFYYTNRIFFGKGVPRFNKKKLLKGCGCDGPCDPDSTTCACVRRQMSWTGDNDNIRGFLYNKKGKLYDPGYPIFECNDACQCSEDCMNRVIQRGRRHQISICLTKGKGWGVFADEKIPRGTYLGIYSGEMLLESEAAERGKLYDKYGRTYLFDLDFYYLRSPEANKQNTPALTTDDAPSTSKGPVPDEERTNLYTIDAFHVGNFTRFLNHSCDPNCVITPSYVNEPDLQKPTLTIFTIRDVKKGEELSFSYFGTDSSDEEEEGEEEGEMSDIGQNKKKAGVPGPQLAQAIHRPCLCGAPNCRGKMF